MKTTIEFDILDWQDKEHLEKMLKHQQFIDAINVAVNFMTQQKCAEHINVGLQQILERYINYLKAVDIYQYLRDRDWDDEELEDDEDY
jgi:hypothetical protein